MISVHAMPRINGIDFSEDHLAISLDGSYDLMSFINPARKNTSPINIAAIRMKIFMGCILLQFMKLL